MIDEMCIHLFIYLFVSLQSYEMLLVKVYDNEDGYAVDLVVINPALRYGEFSRFHLRFVVI